MIIHVQSVVIIQSTKHKTKFLRHEILPLFLFFSVWIWILSLNFLHQPTNNMGHSFFVKYGKYNVTLVIENRHSKQTLRARNRRSCHVENTSLNMTRRRVAQLWLPAIRPQPNKCSSTMTLWRVNKAKDENDVWSFACLISALIRKVNDWEKCSVAIYIYKYIQLFTCSGLNKDVGDKRYTIEAA